MSGVLHVLPVNDLIKHDWSTESGEECICVPTPECVPSESGDGWLIVHHSLDGREANE